MGWLRAWTVPVLFVGFLIAELLAAFVPALRMRTLTRAVVIYVPAQVTTFVVAWLVAWLPRHFRDNYSKRKEDVMANLTDPQPASEPLLSVGTITAAVTALLGLGISFGLNLSEARQTAVLGVIAVLAPIAVAVWGRRKVYSPATVATLLRAKNVPSNLPAPPAS